MASNNNRYNTSSTAKLPPLSLDETLANLTLTLKLKQQQLQEKEHQLQIAADQLERDRVQMFGDVDANNNNIDSSGIDNNDNKKKKCSGSDVLHLNVGGTVIAVLRRTLTS